ncbi:MAG: hypothetical protein ACI8SR_001242 [Oceanicoccus sp.]|jgi:hypothetical protein
MLSLPKSSLELTFNLLRHVQPSIALKVRNAALIPVLTEYHEDASLTFSEEEVFTIVNHLMFIESQARMGAKADKGRQILASALIADWLTFNIRH